MNYTVNVADIEQALVDLGGEAQTQSIQDRVLANFCANAVPENYRSLRTFRQTIQRKIEDYCRDARGFDPLKKEIKFFRVDRGLYRLAVSKKQKELAATEDTKSSENYGAGAIKPKRERPVQASYKVKLPAMREWLVRVTQRGQPVTYGEVATAFSLDRFSLIHALTILGRQAKKLGEPILSAMVVNKRTGRCGPGFDAEFGVNDAEERERLNEFWAEQTVPPSASLPVTNEECMARFVSKEARPQQAAFRRRVFEACGGRCVISGCDLVEVLDAAHKKGRDWRKHNTAYDGYVMRKDLHALYDNGLLMIDTDGTIKVHEAAQLLYGHFAGRCVFALSSAFKDRAN